jgi:hypothetical protein
VRDTYGWFDIEPLSRMIMGVLGKRTADPRDFGENVWRDKPWWFKTLVVVFDGVVFLGVLALLGVAGRAGYGTLLAGLLVVGVVVGAWVAVWRITD